MYEKFEKPLQGMANQTPPDVYLTHLSILFQKDWVYVAKINTLSAMDQTVVLLAKMPKKKLSFVGAPLW